MTYITLSNDMRLMVTKSTPIYRGDNLSTGIIFLLPVKINNVDLSTATVFLSYIRADGEPDMVILKQSAEKYNLHYYQYTLPVSCKLSRYPGQICMWLQICDGNTCHPIVQKTGECVIKIHESKSFDNCMHDHQLTAMYQLKKKLDGLDAEHDHDTTWMDMVPSEDSDDGVWEDMVPPSYDLGDYWQNM